MPSRTSFIAVASLALCLQACVTGRPPAASAPTSYFWLPLIGVSDEETTRTRDLIDAMLHERGYTKGQALALALSTEGGTRSDGSLGLGIYAGGYAYYAPAPAPHGAVVVEAFDTGTLRPVWRATLSSTAIADEVELRRVLDATISDFPPTGAAGQAAGVEPDARGEARGANIDPGRRAIQPITARSIAADGKPTPPIRSLGGVGGAERARRNVRPRALSSDVLRARKGMDTP